MGKIIEFKPKRQETVREYMERHPELVDSYMRENFGFDIDDLEQDYNTSSDENTESGESPSCRNK